MPTWGEVLKEVQLSAKQRGELGPDLDGIRGKYIQQLASISGRAVIVYASGWLTNRGGNDSYLIEGSDVHALMEVCHHVNERQLDLVLHSPGGSPQAAEQMLNYLRSQFDYIRVFVPLQAKSAATMLALGCDEIVMGLHSELGPIDPQIAIPVPGGGRYAPAHAILRDFERAKSELAKNVNLLPAWTPILHSYSGGLIEFCHQQIKLSQHVVKDWLKRYMLRHSDCGVKVPDRVKAANKIAAFFGSDRAYDRLHTHSRPIRVEQLRALKGLRLRALEDSDPQQDAVLSIYHALDFTFGGAAVKIVENHKGARYVRVAQVRPVVAPKKKGR